VIIGLILGLRFVNEFGAERPAGACIRRSRTAWSLRA